MIWLKNCALLGCLLAISVSPYASSKDVQSDNLSNDPAQNIDEDTKDMAPITDASSKDIEDDRGPGPNVGQSVLTPLLGQSLLPEPLNLFSSMFPGLNSLLLLGSLFSAPSLLGASPLLGASQLLDVLDTDELPSASKVVLVLAEDRNPHAAMRAANQEAARTIRQSDMFGQMMAQMRQADIGQMLSQSFEQLQQQNPGQLLQQILPQDLPQSMNQFVSQTFQQLPGLDLSQLPTLGQVPMFGEAIVGAAQQRPDSAVSDSKSPSSSMPAFRLPNIQSALDSSTQMLGQALQQPAIDPNTLFQLPNFQSAFDAGSQMVGQALQQANPDTSGAFQLPKIQSVLDTGSQILSQSGGLFNLRPSPQMSGSDLEPGASQISEVRMKPDAIPTAHNTNEQHMVNSENVEEFKMMPAMQKSLDQKNLPILSLGIPSDLSEKDYEFHKQMQAFQHQVINELKLLQEIERKANEMRAASKGVTEKNYKDTSNHNTSTLSKIPVHKITRGDIEKVLNDIYVKKLLQKVASAKQKGNVKDSFQQLYMPDGAQIKRQTLASTTPKKMSREDIARLMAYAYRMANEKGMHADSDKTTDEISKLMERQWPTDSKDLNRINAIKPMTRQWVDERMQMPQTQNYEQNPTTLPLAREMEDKMSSTMDRQLLDGPKMSKVAHNGRFDNEDSKQQPRQAMAQLPKLNSHHTTDQRQWVDQQMEIHRRMQDNPQVLMQRQWIDTQTQDMPSQFTRQHQITKDTPAEGRKWAEQEPLVALQQSSMAMQQQPKEMQQSQLAMQQQPMAMQQQQMVMQQQQMEMQHPQLAMQQLPMAMQQQQMEMQQPQLAMQHPEMIMQQRQMPMQQFQSDMMMLQQMPVEMEGQAHMLGKATPQMPENAEKARHKGAKILDEFDIFGLGHGFHKGNKKLRPITNNHYYYAGGHAGYGSGAYQTSSYRPSYGYAAPSSGYYRMAVGDDEIKAMLKENYRTKMMNQTDPDPVIAEYVPTTTTFQSITSDSDNSHQKYTSSQPFTSTFSKIFPKVTTTTTAASPATTDYSKKLRLDYKLRLNSVSDKGKSFNGNNVRQKRNANYGTLQTIDANSLNELRKSYKESLKEITLRPDEDPAEALMRYNADSIRQALEHANKEPMEISTNEAEMQTIQTQSSELYFDGGQTSSLDHKDTSKYTMSQPNHHFQYNNHKLDEQPDIVEQQHFDINEQAVKLLTQKQDPTKILYGHEMLTAINDVEQTSWNSKASLIGGKQHVISSLSEIEMDTVFELIKQEIQTCCEICRDRIISSIKTNIRRHRTRAALQKESHHQAAKQVLHLRAADALISEPNNGRDDEQFDKWLREMEAKGYDSKYLSKSHYWEYLNSGKLTLGLESNESEQEAVNKIIKKTDEQQSFKRYTDINSLVDVEEHRSIKSNTSKRSRDEVFTKEIPELNDEIKDHADIVNNKLCQLKENSEEVTPRPYAMGCKFRKTKAKSHIGTSTTVMPIKCNEIPEKSVVGKTVGANKAKVVKLLDLIYDFSSKKESATSKSTQDSVMDISNTETSTEGPEHVTTTSKSRPKRMRKQKAKNKIATQPDPST